METLLWRLYHGDFTVETLPSETLLRRLYHGDFTMETLPLADFTLSVETLPWRLYCLRYFPETLPWRLCGDFTMETLGARRLYCGDLLPLETLVGDIGRL